MKEHRSYTVTDNWKPTHNNPDRHFPQIWLTGDWLKDWGFGIGDRVDVECHQDMIVIKKKAE